MDEAAVQPISDKLPPSVRTIGWVTTTLGIAPTVSLVIFVIYIIIAGAASPSDHLQLSVPIRIMLGVSAGSVYAIVSTTSIIGLFILFILDGFGFLSHFFGVRLLRKSKTAWNYLLISNVLILILYLSAIYLGFALKNSIDWLIVLLSPWPLWNLFVIWKLYEHNKLFGV